jgi:hypothetical protein
MTDRRFETELEAMFAQAPAFADDALFSQAVERRLRRRWLVRQLMLGAAATAGGAVALNGLPQLARDAAPWLDRGAALLETSAYGVPVLLLIGMAGAALVALRQVEI